MNPQTPLSPSAADPRQQVLEQIKASTNVLLTVSENPTVDQLAAVIGMALLLNKMGKHATAVFSGQVPPTIEFLQPEKTLEKTTDSLRDFIIALDKSKADKLRYKIEDKFVKIYITPYHTSLTDKDLEFSQGDYNVDVILALGVKKRDDLDQTIIAHGRILHDATVISVNNTPGADIGSINWMQSGASSLCEMMVNLSEDLKTNDQKLLDEQISTCFLTGVVAQTNRFSNSKTTPQTMSVAAKLMNAGANQQLIATKLEPPAPIPKEPEQVKKPPEPPKPSAPPPAPPKPPTTQPPAGPPPAPKPAPTPTPTPTPTAEKIEDKKVESHDGTLEVPHEGVSGDDLSYGMEDENISKIHIDDQGTLKQVTKEIEESKKANQTDSDGHKMINSPPSLNGNLSAGAKSENDQTMVDPLTLPSAQPPTLDHGQSAIQANAKGLPEAEGKDNTTLTDLEESVHSPHLREVDDRPGDTEPHRDLIGPDKGLPVDKTAGNPNPSPPPPVPPPLPMAPPPKYAPGNMSDPNAGVPL